MRGVFAAVLGIVLFATAAQAEPPVRDSEVGWWDAELRIESASQQITFELWLPPQGDERSAYIRNGEEFISVQHTKDQDSLTLDFPHYDSQIIASRATDARFEGIWTKTRGEAKATMSFGARRRPHVSDFMEESVDELEEVLREPEVLGEYQYAMSFEKSGEAKGTFQIIKEFWSPRIRGTIETSTGDYRYLSGFRRSANNGNRLYWNVSVFDGAHAFLFTADVDPESGNLTNGHFYSGNHWHETFTARRLKDGETYELPDPFAEVSLKSGVTRLGLPKLSEPPYAGQPTIVQIFGTWCPNCHDEAPVLVDLYDKHHDDGLQILSLAYEYTDDAERSRRQIERFKERHGATWEFVAAGVSDKKKTAATLPALSTIKSYPTTIWINPDGTVHAIHSGFSGPATGEAHEESLKEFKRLTKEIVEAQ